MRKHRSPESKSPKCIHGIPVSNDCEKCDAEIESNDSGEPSSNQDGETEHLQCPHCGKHISVSYQCLIEPEDG